MKGTIIGNLGKDATLKTSQNGTVMCGFSVADTVGYGDNKKTQWVNCTLFGKRGESLQQYLLKGTKVVVFGEVSVREYQDSNGCGKWSLDCVVSDVTLVGSKPAGAPASTTAANSSVDSDEIPF